MNNLGLVGLGVMGGNLARNFADKGFKIALFDRHYDKTKDFLERYGSENFAGYEKLKDLIESLEKPRRVLMMVTAGPAVDEVMKTLQPLLSQGDIVIDGGNSFFEETERRVREWQQFGLNFVGSGISGGEEGALHGPSIMPGGSEEAWQALKPLLEKIAARDFHGGPCVTHIGKGGAGHYVKMVHNGIEYAIMQLMAEIYDFARKIEQKEAGEIAAIFKHIQQSPAQSFLSEIAIPVLEKKEGPAFLVDKVLDKAAQKGTGGWTATEGLRKGVPISAISEAVFARSLSSWKDLRDNINRLYYTASKATPVQSTLELLDYAHIYLFGMIVAYAQGFHLISEASQEAVWGVDLAEVSRIWQGGCIIRSNLLETIQEIMSTNQGSKHLMETQPMLDLLKQTVPSFRKFVMKALENEVALPVASSMLAYFDSLKENHSPANFIQGLRDFFGAHTFERVDKKGIFHANWNQ